MGTELLHVQIYRCRHGLAMPLVAPSKVVVHPIVLLSVVDHFNRIQKISNQRRVVGVLLGSWHKGTVDVATSFAGAPYINPHSELTLMGPFNVWLC